MPASVTGPALLMEGGAFVVFPRFPYGSRSSPMKEIRVTDNYGDGITVGAACAGDIYAGDIYVEAREDSTIATFGFSPKAARRLARALKRAARAVEEASISS
jgi:hypothetical protein